MVVRALPLHRLGGLEFHAQDLCDALARRGHEVTIVTSRHPEGLDSSTTPGGAEVHHLAAGKPGDYSLPFFREAGRRVAELDSARCFDIIHVQEYAGLFIKPLPQRTVVTVHGTMFTEVPLDRRFFPHLSSAEKIRALWQYRARLALSPIFHRMLTRADRLICDSEFTRMELGRFGTTMSQKANVVPLGIDTARYSAVAVKVHAEKSFTLLVLGRMQFIKGVMHALDAATLLHERQVNFRMVFGGRGSWEAALCSEIRVRGLEDCVEYAGPVAPEETSEFFARGDALLFPDLTQPAFGLVAVEAMLHGLPVIGARSGAIPEVVTEQSGWLYDPWNVAELAALIQRLANSRDEVLHKAKAARAQSGYYTADRMAAGVEAIYHSLR